MPIGRRGHAWPFRIALPYLGRGISYEGQTTFAVIGDYGVCAVGGCADETRVADMVKRWEPQFIVTTGDNNYPRGKWDTWAANTAPYREFIPDRFEPAIGNHDYVCSQCPDYPFRRNFGRELTRAFVKPSAFDPLVGFFMIDSNPADNDPETEINAKAASENPLSRQRQWLERELDEVPACFKLVFMHHPPYSSTTNPGSHRALQSSSGWNYRQWGADAVLSGHAHNYERIDRSGGFAYIVNGTGGALRDPLPAVGLSGSVVRVDDAFGAIRGRADTKELVLEFFTVDSRSAEAPPRLRDTFRVARDCER